MVFFQEMVWSSWHLLALGLTCIAFIAMIVGGYSKKQITSYTIKSFLFFYIITSALIIFITYDDHVIKKEMYAHLDEIYDLNRGIENDHLVAVVKNYVSENKMNTIKVYAGNYDDDETFEGVLRLQILTEDGEEEENVYEQITLEPGEKKEIDSYRSEKITDRFFYLFIEN